MESTLPVWVEAIAALGPLLVLCGALTAAVLVWAAGRRDRWWARAQWAIDRTHSSSHDEQEMGLAVLSALFDRAPSKEERAIVEEIVDAFLVRFGPYEGEDVEYVLDDEATEADHG